jgi:hypothetical protein
LLLHWLVLHRLLLLRRRWLRLGRLLWHGLSKKKRENERATGFS